MPKERSWKGYFLEFLMLFLAVSLGFLADNFREKISERTRETEYIQSMIEDVEEDKKNIKDVIARNEDRVLFLDSLVNACNDYRGSEKETVALNMHFVHVLMHPEFIAPTELTMQQLKNAGGMRLIKSKEAINEIIRYDSQLKKLANQQVYYQDYQNKAIDVGTKIFNIQKLIQTLRASNGAPTANNFQLINNNKASWKEMGNAAAMYKGIIEYYVFLLMDLEKQGEVLVETLQKHYDLDE